MDLTLTPKNPIATFIDEYGDERIIHRKQGRRLSVFCGGDTVALTMNRAAAVLIGRRIKEKRLSKSMSQKVLCQRAGLQNVNPKQYICAIESAKRLAGCRTGTLYALAFALECEVSDLMPTVAEIIYFSGIETDVKALTM